MQKLIGRRSQFSLGIVNKIFGELSQVVVFEVAQDTKNGCEVPLLSFEKCTNCRLAPFPVSIKHSVWFMPTFLRQCPYIVFVELWPCSSGLDLVPCEMKLHCAHILCF